MKAFGKCENPRKSGIDAVSPLDFGISRDSLGIFPAKLLIPIDHARMGAGCRTNILCLLRLLAAKRAKSRQSAGITSPIPKRGFLLICVIPMPSEAEAENPDKPVTHDAACRLLNANHDAENSQLATRNSKLELTMSEPADITAARELLNVLSGNEPTTTTLLGRAEADLRAKQSDPLQPKPPQPAHANTAASAFTHSAVAPSLKPINEDMLDERTSRYLLQLERAKHAPRCQHIKADGVRCGSPSLRHKNFCHFHHRLRIPKPNPIWHLPALEDANGVQCAIMQVTNALLRKQIDRLTANSLLYALQTAASNLKRVNFEPSLTKLIANEARP